MKTILLTAALSLLLCPLLHAEGYAPGKIHTGIRCEGDREYSYLLYLPSGYSAERKEGWPVLFAMSPQGGNEGALKRYVRGAEQNNWIVAMSVESKNHNNDSGDAIEAMAEDVFERFHADEKRCYATGFSGGARMAFWQASEMKSNIIGIIPCGAGGDPSSSRLLAYGLCGSTCFNRWDMAVSFDNIRKGNGRLRFFDGAHHWANESLCTDAITWLNGKYLAKKGSKPEIDAFSAMLIEKIQKAYDTDPYFAYEQACVLAEVTKAPDAAKAKKVVTKLQADPKIQLYLEGLEEMDDFVDEHFNTTSMDYKNNPCTSSQKKDAANLLAKYGDTPLAKTIKGFGEPSGMP